MTPSQLFTIVGLVTWAVGLRRTAGFFLLAVGIGGMGYLLGKEAAIRNLPWNVRTALALSVQKDHTKFYGTHLPQLFAGTAILLSLTEKCS